MDRDAHKALLDEIVDRTGAVVRSVCTRPDRPDLLQPALEDLCQLQRRFCSEFPVSTDAVRFWETLWLRTDLLRDQWLRLQRSAERVGGEVRQRLQPLLDAQRSGLYQWMRRFASERSPVRPCPAHLDLGIERDWPHLQAHHERMEGLYESVKRIGRLPVVQEGVSPPSQGANLAIIYGGGWNVSTFSILREAARLDGLNAFVAFDYPGADLFGRAGNRTVRLAPAGLFRRADGDDYFLATFSTPAVVHFACPHAWTGPPPHELGLPVLRSVLTLEIVNEKINTSRALCWYAERTGADLPLIPERSVAMARVPVDLDELYRKVGQALDAAAKEGLRDVVIKPSGGEMGRDVGRFDLRGSRQEATEHAVRLALESAVVIQKRVQTPLAADFNWRVFVALQADGSPAPVGRFARRGHGDEMEMLKDGDILRYCGMEGSDAESFCDRLDRVSVEAFRAVVAYAEHTHPDFPWKPLGGGSYAVPYLLGVDLIGDAMLMEVNGNEVAGMWTHDRLYPELRGQTNRTVLESALRAAVAYQEALGQEP